MGIDLSQYSDRIDVWSLRGNLRNIFELASEFDGIERGAYKVILLDAKYRMIGDTVSENDNAAETRFYNAVDQIAERTGAAVGMIHHSSKGSQSDRRVTDVGAGAGAQSRAADCHLVLREHEQDDAVVLAAAVRSFPPIEPLCLRFAFPLWVPDETLEGGGLHQSERGGFLNVHADFTVHPHRRDWRRRLNLLLYLNTEWDESYGGYLELWDTEMHACRKKIGPILNRCVIFSTDPTSFHGHPDPMTCPPGTTRKSLALYYFTQEEAPLVRSTEYRARPGEGVRGLGIYLDKMALRLYDRTKRALGLDDRFASGLLRLLSGRRR